ncbi:MAG: hypothetical protein HQ580_00995 [Planctomycetes bacterium]|nr:hypothetical protein [Planctomycetota bacterium]
MSDMCMKNQESKLRCFKSKILLGALALAVIIIGLGTVANAASDNKSDKLLSGQMSTFDPFTLKSTRVAVTRSENESDPGLDILLAEMIYVSPAIRIPYRPALRTPFRPLLILR